MAMGRQKPKQQGLWVSTGEMAKPAAHLVYS